MEDSNFNDLSIFFLVAVITVALGFFVTSVNEFVAYEAPVNGLAQVSVAQETEKKPLVTLLASPGIVFSGEPTVLTWEVQGTASTCVGASEPVVSEWDGEKDTDLGTHAQVIGELSSDTTFTISCDASSGNSSISSITVIVQ